MNERMKELAEQAGLKSEIMLDDSSRDVECFVSEYDGSTPSIHYWKKFAELIIQECISVVDYDDGATHVRELLLEHFGVEE
jgi:hypothetical protein